MKQIKLIFLLLFLLQLTVPFSMIIKKEIILNQGEIVKFQVKPVDPYDAFRGKYLSIGILNNRIKTKTEDFRSGQKVNVLIAVDSDGFGSPTGITRAPSPEQLYLKCTVAYTRDDYIVLNFPFDRYYINEDYSQLGEDLYNKYSNGGKEDAYISVRVKKGNAVLEHMYLAGIEINQFIRSKLEGNK